MRESSEPLSRLLTAPVILVALLGRTAFNVTLYRDKDDQTIWWFRFSYRAVLKVSDAGEWRWQRSTPATRAAVEPLIVRACELAADALQHVIAVMLGDVGPRGHEERRRTALRLVRANLRPDVGLDLEMPGPERFRRET